MNRRDFVRTSVVAGLGLAFAPLLTGAELCRFKIGACEWSLGKCDPASLDIAKQIGLDGVQVDMGWGKQMMHLNQPAVRQAYLAKSKETGVAISSLGILEMNNAPLKSDPRAAKWLEDSIAAAQALDVRVILVPAFAKGDLCGDKTGIDRAVDIFKEVASKAEKAGVILGFENYLSADDNLDILQRVGSSSVQVYYDVGNSTDKGRDVYKEIRMLKGKVCEFHAKDAGHRLGKGRIDFHKVREAMDEIGFTGWIQLESSAPHGVVVDYRTDLAYLRGIFK